MLNNYIPTPPTQKGLTTTDQAPTSGPPINFYCFLFTSLQVKFPTIYTADPTQVRSSYNLPIWKFGSCLGIH